MGISRQFHRLWSEYATRRLLIALEWECAYPGEVCGSTNLCYTSVVLTTLVLKPEVLPRHWPSCQVLQVHANNGRLRHNLRGARRRRKSSGATRTKSSNPHHYSRSWERYNVSNNSRQLSVVEGTIVKRFVSRAVPHTLLSSSSAPNLA